MIDYELINKSIEYYKIYKFERIEAPWTVSRYIDDITRPSNAQEFEISYNQKRLVASGEQSFLYLYLKNFLPYGNFQTVTPCYRFEEFDFEHTKYFMKNELIKTDIDKQQPIIDQIKRVANISLDFFNKYLNAKLVNQFDTIPEITDKENLHFDIITTINGKDYELGSYGYRNCEFLEWIYGTGIAEPRLSNLIKLNN